MSPCAHYISLLIYPPYFGRASYYPVTMSWITCYRVSYYSVPCLLLPCTMFSITLYHVLNILLPCLLLPCTMSSITLLLCLPLPCYYVFHYPVTMSSITLLLCLPLPCYYVFHYPVSIKECKTTKKSWQVNYPKEPYSSKQLTCQLVYLFTRLLKISQPFIISSSWTQQA